MTLRLISLLGVVSFLGLAWAMSSNRRQVPWRVVAWGMGLQFLIGLAVFQTPLGQGIFDAANVAITKLNAFANEGAKLVFGALADKEGMEGVFGAGKGVIFVISIPATIIFVSALSSLLYHWRVLQWVVAGIAWVMRRTMRTSGSETLATAANVFMGQTEAPLVVKPYLGGMTRSELMALMTSGMATIAGGVAAAYALMGINAGHLMTASILSAPGTLVIAKLMFPETARSETADERCALPKSSSANSLDALCQGAADGMRLSINVIAMLIAFIAVVHLANAILAWVISPMGWSVTIQEVIGWLNVPFAWLMSVPPEECVRVGTVLGERVVFNEFVGYLSLSNLMEGEGALSKRTIAIVTYALCGFANFASVAIQIGGISTLAPERRVDLAKLGLRAMVGGLLACYLTATVAGLLMPA
ncbi:MAG: Na+ dependent nucleoside transporter domain protein [Verrucomicrobiales bacterium]|jgi:CNT family concentrative nucleoside transporter|nr:Na+ dependent nucleoside transporter domain protein [Verrucomicrobiales bacterium]MDP6679290.1 nucleoside transporter C-terminal domain-containing protein [Verrucomicrobiota bacterium]MDP6753580.1 nucleoside transporter C-terminal domain-containing protein [Verrucomicrobiota bacterium]MDP7013759.1 nucleoside transporter C-terminal domain-containing protein [Verrucomicrobiota bacterium]